MKACGFFFRGLVVKEITVLCKVVDNFGDIGVVWRLCRVLLENDSLLKINLVVDDLKAFSCIWGGVDVGKDFQVVNGVKVYNWKSIDFCYSEFFKNDGEKLQIILECFQCGRPDWMEKILFEDKLQRTVQVVMIDYLTAEKYAEDFHCLQSLTRSAKVQKVNFMPGFTAKTGGLIIGEEWKRLPERNANGPILVFTYERNWKPLVKAMYNSQCAIRNGVKIAQGRGLTSFEDSWKAIENKFPILHSQLSILPYLPQNEWDKMMKECSVLIIRGEESMSRACLSGIPFVWHAYPQSDEYQLVKVNALLERMKQHFYEEDFKIVEKVWLLFNKPESDVTDDEMETACTEFLQKADSFVYGFRSFAESLLMNGDLSEHLLKFIFNN